MALIICPECNKEISSKAESCPNCGLPLKSKVVEWNLEHEKNTEQQNREFLDSLGEKRSSRKSRISYSKKGKGGSGCFVTFLIFLFFAVILIVNLSDNNDNSSKNTSETTSIDNSITPSIAIKYSKVSLNVRKNPDGKSKILKVLKPNEKVTTKGVQENGFTQILNSNNRSYGWCSTEYLQDFPLTKSQLEEIELRKIEAAEKRAVAWKNIDNSIGAWTIVTMSVREMLLSPRTAKFPWGGPSEHVTRNGQVYTIKSYVDSQNAFGAMIRTRFTAKVEQTAKDEWSVISFEFN